MLFSESTDTFIQKQSKLSKYQLQEVMMRKRPPPPTKDGSTGERLDTNTFVSQVAYI
jgi:hypothetical protein